MRRPPYVGAAPGCGERRRQSGGADDGGHDPVGIRRGRLQQRLATGSGHDARSGQRILQRGVVGVIGGDGHTGAKILRLAGQKLDVAVAGDRHEVEGVPAAELGQDIQRVDPDGAGRAENGDASMRAGAACHTFDPW